MQTRARLVPVVVTALVAALAGVGALAWFALAPSRDDAVGAAQERSSADGATSAATEAAPTDALEAAAAERAHDAEAARRVEEAPVIPADHLLVVVRRAEDHAPLAGATVTWAGESALQLERRWRGNDPSYVDENELVEEIGARGTTDARGFCFVPVDPEPARREHLVIGARRDALWALVTTDARRSTVPIELSADDAIRVQVLAADGTPLPGVVAAFGMAKQSQRQSRRARTEGRDAIATIRGVAAFAAFFQDGDRQEWGVSAVLPLRTPAFTPVDLHALPTEPVVVRVPACGRMSIGLLGRDGQPIRRKARIRVITWPRFEQKPPGAGPPSGKSTTIEQSLATSDGWLELPCVDVGVTLDVEVEVDRAHVGHAFLDGPDAVGERIERKIDLDWGSVKFVGTLLRSDDTPAARERLTLRVVGNRGQNVLPFDEPSVGEGTTDEEGKYSIEVPIAGGAYGLDCHVLVHSATGVERTLAAIAVVRKNGIATMGTLHVPAD